MLGVLISLKNLGERCPYIGVGTGGSDGGVSEFLHLVYTKPLDICYRFAAV